MNFLLKTIFLFMALPMFSLHSGTCEYEEFMYGNSGCTGAIETDGRSTTTSSAAECSAICDGICHGKSKYRLCMYTR